MKYKLEYNWFIISFTLQMFGPILSFTHRKRTHCPLLRLPLIEHAGSVQQIISNCFNALSGNQATKKPEIFETQHLTSIEFSTHSTALIR